MSNQTQDNIQGKIKDQLQDRFIGQQSNKYKVAFTCCGMVTVLIWSSNIFMLKETLRIYGYVSGIALIYLFSGVLGMIIFTLRNNLFEKIKNKDYSDFTKVSKTSVLVCVLMIFNNIFSSLSFGTSPKGEVLLQVIIISELWPILVNILLIRILHYKIKNKILFGLGITSGIMGVIVACIGFDFKNINFTNYVTSYYYCYLFAIITAISWSFYTAYLKKYEPILKDDHIIISMLLSGLVMLPISFCNPNFNNYGNIQADIESIGLMIYEIVVACSLAYYLWNIGFKYGNTKAISNFSILAPLLNVIFTSIFYQINVMYNIICGAIMLIFAVICCKYGITSPNSQEIQTKQQPTNELIELEVDLRTDLKANLLENGWFYCNDTDL